MKTFDLMWLSFSDGDRPEGDRHLGCVIIRANDIITAVRIAHALGINPGGSVRAMPIDPERMKMLSFDLPIEKFLRPEEARDLEKRIADELDE